ncbi:MAG: hypothetical protein FJX52_12575 [Alphaproteobacteria bacterium]|nr:hypothetical protein [Alphaproteobacteria bacterium]
MAAASLASAVARPALDLSGPRLTQAFESLLRGTEDGGGIERMVRAIAFKSDVFAAALAGGKAARLDAETFQGLCAMIAPVRRRVGKLIAEQGAASLLAAVAELFEGAGDTATADARIAGFRARLPQDRGHRWVRDLAGELLHYALPEQYPLIARWIWDAGTNTGVLREIWYGADVDRMTIPAGDDYATFLMLREELSQFLSRNGVFRDMLFYIDLLCAHVYADYVASQGGTYLRADFSVPEDPLLYTRRMLGLDGIDPATGRTRLKLGDGESFVIAGSIDSKEISSPAKAGDQTAKRIDGRGSSF